MPDFAIGRNLFNCITKGVILIQKITVLFILLSATAFAADKYFNGDNYLENNNYSMAAREFDNIVESDGGVAVSDDIRALTGSLISHYMLQDYERSFAVCKRVLRLDSYNSAAILYSGLNLEAQDNRPVAAKILRYYTVLPKSDPYRRLIKVKYDELTVSNVESQVRKAIDAEKKLKAPLLSDNSLVFLFMSPERDDAKWNNFGRAYTQLLIDDLSSFSDLKVISIDQMKAMISVLGAQPYQLLNENVMRRIARIFQCRYIVGGFYNATANNTLDIDLEFIDLQQAQNTDKLEFTSETDDFYKLKKEILKTLLNAMDVTVTRRDLRKINAVATRKIDAFLAYGNALYAYENNNFGQSRSYLGEALKMDSRFEMAKDLSGIVDALIVIANNDLASYHVQSRHYRSAYSIGEITSLSRARLNNMSMNLDLGYLPGNESRNGASGVYIPDIIEPVKLGEPPNPPGN